MRFVFFGKVGINPINAMSEKLENILDEVCKYLSINVSDVKSDSRRLDIKTARFYYCYIARTIYNIELKHIGLVINRKHATVIHANNTVKKWMCYDKKVKKQLEEIGIN